MSEELSVTSETIDPVTVASLPGEDPTEASSAQVNPDLTFPTQEKLNERLGRHYSSQFKKDFGVNDPSAIKSKLKELATLKEAEEGRAREAMSAQEKLEADLKIATAERTALAEERDQMRFESHVKGICAELGVTNVDYAMFEVARAAEKVPEDQQLDVKDHLAGLMDKTQSRAALGLPPASQTVESPVTTTPAGNPPDPSVPTAAGEINAMDMSREQFNKHLAEMGVGLTG